ncbi:MAG: hypothetical protein AAGC79_16400 [Pseudomonadota bacterium]
MCAFFRLTQIVGDPLLWICVLWGAWLLYRVLMGEADRGRRLRQLGWVAAGGFGITVAMNLASVTELSHCLPPPQG